MHFYQCLAHKGQHQNRDMTLCMLTLQQMSYMQSTEIYHGAGNHDKRMTTTKRYLLSSNHLCTTKSICQAILDPKTSKRIFELARDQQDELNNPDVDEDVIEDDFTRPRTRNLEELDDDDEDEEEEFQGFQDDEERELVRHLTV
jgi:hypothetical protein